MTDHTCGPTLHGREVYIGDGNFRENEPIAMVLSGPGLHAQDYLTVEQARDLGNALLALALKHDPETVGVGVEPDSPNDWPEP